MICTWHSFNILHKWKNCFGDILPFLRNHTHIVSQLLEEQRIFQYLWYLWCLLLMLERCECVSTLTSLFTPSLEQVPTTVARVNSAEWHSAEFTQCEWHSASVEEHICMSFPVTYWAYWQSANSVSIRRYQHFFRSVCREGAMPREEGGAGSFSRPGASNLALSRWHL